MLNKDPSRQEWLFTPLLPAPSIPAQSSCELTSPLGTSGHHSPYLLCPMNRVPPLQEQTTHIRRYRNRTLCSMETKLSVFGWRCHQKSRQSSYTVVQCLSCYWNKGQSVCLSLQTQIRHRFPHHKDQTPSSHHWERTRAQFYLTTQTFTGDHGVPCWTRLLPGSCREGQPSLYRTQNLWRIPHIPNLSLKVHSQCPLEWKYHVGVVYLIHGWNFSAFNQ